MADTTIRIKEYFLIENLSYSRGIIMSLSGVIPVLIRIIHYLWLQNYAKILKRQTILFIFCRFADKKVSCFHLILPFHLNILPLQAIMTRHLILELAFLWSIGAYSQNGWQDDFRQWMTIEDTRKVS